MKEFGVYMHIPFCKSKCLYCDFVSYENKEEHIEQYIEAVKREIVYKFNEIREDFIIDTLYIGGGTPSFINEKYICELLNMSVIKSKIKKDAEITIEVNPGTVNEIKLKEYKKAGINRISMGLQSTDDSLLKCIGRIHNYKDFIECYDLVRKIGFGNVNVDLMLALPGQTMENLEQSVKEVIGLNPEHISVYSLILEEDTKLFELVKSNKIFLPEENQEREMYWRVKGILEDSGYNHYEVSNYSKVGFESKHNINCWEQHEYLGVGLAAHSYYNSTRFSNSTNMEKYIENVYKDKIEENVIINEVQNNFDKEKEYIMLGLRKIEGVDFRSFTKKFKEDAKDVFKDEFSYLVQNGLVLISDNVIKLSNKGLDFANLVWEKFV